MKEFRYIEGAAILKLDKAACTGCGMCEIVCPHRVFKRFEKKATIVDYDACMECGACARNCPAGAIFVNPDDGCGCARYILNSGLPGSPAKNLQDAGADHRTSTPPHSPSKPTCRFFRKKCRKYDQ